MIDDAPQQATGEEMVVLPRESSRGTIVSQLKSFWAECRSARSSAHAPGCDFDHGFCDDEFAGCRIGSCAVPKALAPEADPMKSHVVGAWLRGSLQPPRYNMADASPAPLADDTNDWGARADLAFEQARTLPPGPERMAKLKMARMLRQASDIYHAFFRRAPA